MIKVFLSSLFFIGLGIAGTLVYQEYFKEQEKPRVEIVEKTKIVTKYVTRDYDKIPKNDLIKELQAYDKGPFDLDGEMSSPYVFHARAKLHKRTAERDFKLKVHETPNFKYYVGAGIAGVIAGGIVVYKLRK